MWLLLLVSFGLTSCLLIALAIFELISSDTESEERKKKTFKPTSTVHLNAASEDLTAEAER